MKTKFDKNTMKSIAVLGAGALLGTLVSKGAMAIAPDEVREPIVQTGLGLGSFAVSGAIQGDGTLENLTRGALMGVAINSTVNGINGFVAPSIPEDNKFLKAAFGMNAAEESYDYNYDAPISIPSQTVWNDSPENSFLETESTTEYKFAV